MPSWDEKGPLAPPVVADLRELAKMIEDGSGGDAEVAKAFYKIADWIEATSPR